jgi:hypothetical protein
MPFSFRIVLGTLWLAVAGLVILTAVLIISSVNPAIDCNSLASPNSTTGTSITVNPGKCSVQMSIASFVYHYRPYFQSTHIVIIHAIATCTLMAFQPALLANQWAKLEAHSSESPSAHPKMTIKTFQSGIGLSQSPGWVAAFCYMLAIKSVTSHSLFVFVVGILSVLSAYAVSPIYQSHKGPYDVTASLNVGGGVGPSMSPTFSLTDIIGGGVVAGRALINSGTAARSGVPLVSFNFSAAPFLSRDAVQTIWSAEAVTAVAYNTLDCGPSAPKRLTSSQNIVTLDPASYFAPNQGLYYSSPLYAGQTLGSITNDPQMSAVYLNRTPNVAPGSVTAETSIIFLAANGTLEGAQQRITSPEPTARILFVDVLVCTSTTTLIYSRCTIYQGNVSNCEAVPLASLPSKASTSATGLLEAFVSNPISTATILSASPVMAYYSATNRLPMYDTISESFISDQIPPLSFLSGSTRNTIYSIPLSYIQNVLFGQTAQGLVQGMITAWPVQSNQTVFLEAPFATSQSYLPYLIMFVAFAFAMAATLASTIPRSSRQATEIDATRLIAISRNPQLDEPFERYSERTVAVSESFLLSKVVYKWVGSLGRRVLVLEPEKDAHTETIWNVEKATAIELETRKENDPLLTIDHLDKNIV